MSLAAIAVLLLAAHTAALLHEVTTVHAVCAEHGEYLEGSEHAASQEAAADPESSSYLPGAAAAEDGAHHEHCPVAAFRSAASVRGAAVELLPVAVPAPAKPLAHAEPRAPAIAVYRVAPKSSPPA